MKDQQGNELDFGDYVLVVEPIWTSVGRIHDIAASSNLICIKSVHSPYNIFYMKNHYLRKVEKEDVLIWQLQGKLDER